MNEIDIVYLYLAVCSLLTVWMKVMSLLVLSCLIFPGLFARTGKASAYVCLCRCFVKTTKNSIRQDTTEQDKQTHAKYINKSNISPGAWKKKVQKETQPILFKYLIHKILDWWSCYRSARQTPDCRSLRKILQNSVLFLTWSKSILVALQKVQQNPVNMTEAWWGITSVSYLVGVLREELAKFLSNRACLTKLWPSGSSWRRPFHTLAWRSLEKTTRHSREWWTESEKISPKSGLSDLCINSSMRDTLEKYIFSKLWTDEAVIEVLTKH